MSRLVGGKTIQSLNRQKYMNGRWITLGLVAASALTSESLFAHCAFESSSPQTTITYRFQPTIASDELVLHVSIEFDSGPQGTGVLQIPTEWAGESLKSIQELHAASPGTYLEPAADQAHVRFRARPHELISVTYELKRDWSGALVHPKQFHPVLLLKYFEITGSNSLVTPISSPESKVTVNFDWQQLPADWALATSFGTTSSFAGRCQSYSGAWKGVDKGLYAGGDFRIHPFKIGNRQAFLAIRGKWSFTDDEAADQIAAVVSRVREFWHDDNFPYFLVTLKPYDLNHGSSDGSAFTNAFWMYLSSQDLLSDRLSQLAHETFHAWNPMRMGAQPAGSMDTTNWFKEGFTEYYAELLTFKAGELTPIQYVNSINQDLRKFPISRSEYVRGRVIALWLDATIRGESKERHSLDDVMHDMVRNSRRSYTLASILDEAGRYLSPRSRALLRSAVLDHVDLLAPATLPAVRICARPQLIDLPTFDIGLDLTHTFANSLITGVVPDGPAYRAGLRDGQRLLDIDVDNGNPDSIAKFRVRTEGGDRMVTYTPRGTTIKAWQYDLGPAECDIAH